MHNKIIYFDKQRGRIHDTLGLILEGKDRAHTKGITFEAGIPLTVK